MNESNCHASVRNGRALLELESGEQLDARVHFETAGDQRLHHILPHGGAVTFVADTNASPEHAKSTEMPRFVRLELNLAQVDHLMTFVPSDFGYLQERPPQ